MGTQIQIALSNSTSQYTLHLEATDSQAMYNMDRVGQLTVAPGTTQTLQLETNNAVFSVNFWEKSTFTIAVTAVLNGVIDANQNLAMGQVGGTIKLGRLVRSAALSRNPQSSLGYDGILFYYDNPSAFAFVDSFHLQLVPEGELIQLSVNQRGHVALVNLDADFANLPRFALQSVADGRYVTVAADCTTLTLSSDSQQTSTMFSLSPVQPNQVTIRTRYGAWLSSDGHGGVVANAPNGSTFSLAWDMPGVAALRCPDGTHYLNYEAADSRFHARGTNPYDGNCALGVTALNLQALQLMLSQGYLSTARATLQTVATGDYLRWQAPSGVLANGVPPGPGNDVFELRYVGPDKISIRAHNSLYLCAEGGGTAGTVVANRGEVGAWETFHCVWTGNGIFELYTASGQHMLAIDPSGRSLVAIPIAAKSTSGPWAAFGVSVRG